MNLQATHEHPWASAVALDDKRVNKMCLETAQMYCTATSSGPYRPTHASHPLIPWAKRNISWLIAFHTALAGEYYYRTGKMHKSFIDVGQHMPQHELIIPQRFYNGARSSHMSANGAAIDFTDISDVHQAYRYYMRARWYSDTMRPVWTRRGKPAFLDERLMPRKAHYPLMLTSTMGVSIENGGWRAVP